MSATPEGLCEDLLHQYVRVTSSEPNFANATRVPTGENGLLLTLLQRPFWRGEEHFGMVRYHLLPPSAHTPSGMARLQDEMWNHFISDKNILNV